jgi:hypothetical protein
LVPRVVPLDVTRAEGGFLGAALVLRAVPLVATGPEGRLPGRATSLNREILSGQADSVSSSVGSCLGLLLIVRTGSVQPLISGQANCNRVRMS